MISDLSNLIKLHNDQIISSSSEEETLNEEEEYFSDFQYIPAEISESFDILEQFQEEIINNITEEIPLSVIVIKFISKYQTIYDQFNEFLKNKENSKKNLMKIIFQLINSIISSKQLNNHNKLVELFYYYADDIHSLFKPNELIDIFINDKRSIYLLYEHNFISIDDIISIPFNAQNKTNQVLANTNSSNTNSNLRNNSNSQIRRSFSTSASIFNTNSNFNVNSNLRNSANANLKLPVTHNSNSSSLFNISSRKMSFDLSSSLRPNINSNSAASNNEANQNAESNKFEFSGSPYEEIVQLFQPEIEKVNSNFIQLFPNLFGQSDKYLKSDKKELFFKYREEFQNENPIVSAILKDDVECLQTLILDQFSENLDSITINHSIFERINFLNDKQNPPKMIEYAAFCGSVKIFKYLLLDIHGNSIASSLPPLHSYQQQQFQQREQLIKQQREQLMNLQSAGQLGLVQKQQRMQILKQQEQLKKYQAQYQQKYQEQQSQIQQQQQQQILNKIPGRLHQFACAGGCAEIIHILEQEGFFADEKRKKESIEISIEFHQNDIFDYFTSAYNFSPSIDMLMACVRSANYHCFFSLFEQFHSSIAFEVNKKGKGGQGILHIAAELGRIEFVRFLTAVDYEGEKERKNEAEKAGLGSVGININVRDSNGFSPLHLAAAGGHIEVVSYLVSFYSSREKSCGKSQAQNSPSPKMEPITSPPLSPLGTRPQTALPARGKIPEAQQTALPTPGQSLFANPALQAPRPEIKVPGQASPANPTSLPSRPEIAQPSRSLVSSAASQAQKPDAVTQGQSLVSGAALQVSNNEVAVVQAASQAAAGQSSIIDQTMQAPIQSPQISPAPILISSSKSAPVSPKLVPLPPPNLSSLKSNSIRRKLNTVSFAKADDQLSKTVSLGSLSASRQFSSTTRLNLNVKDFKGRTSAQIGYERGFTEVAKYLVMQKEFDINARDDGGHALIHLAVMNSDLDFLSFMTREAGERLNANIETKKDHKTALLIAASRGDVGTVKYLMSLKSVNKKCRDSGGQMAHHIACSSQKKEKNEMLGEKGESTNDQEREEAKRVCIDKYTKYYMKESIKASNHKAVSANSLDENECKDSASIEDTHERSCISSDSKDSASIEETIEKSCILCDDKTSANNSEEGFVASNLDVLKYLIEEQDFDVNEKDCSRQTPLHHACSVGDIRIVGYLIAVKGIDINARDKEGRTPLIAAFTSGNLPIAKFLVESSDADIGAVDNDGRNSLHLSSQKGLFENVVYIFSLQDQHKKSANRQPLFHNDRDESDTENDIENESKDPSVLDANSPDSYGRTCLHLSFEGGNVELIKFLLNRPEIDLNARDKGGRTLLHFAASFNYLFIIDFLASLGPIPRKLSCNGGSYGYDGGYGYGYGRQSSSRKKFDLKNVNAKANHDWTALHFAAAGGFVEMCQFLVSIKYVNANARDSTGMTPLHLAVQYEKIDAVKYLANVPEVYVNSQDNEGRTPLHVACSMGLVEIIKLLVSCKEIDLTKLDKKSQTAFKHLSVEKQKSLAYLFK